MKHVLHVLLHPKASSISPAPSYPLAQHAACRHHTICVQHAVRSDLDTIVEPHPRVEHTAGSQRSAAAQRAMRAHVGAFVDGNGVGTNETLDLLGNVIGNGRVNAQVISNTFNSNNGNDVYFESFTSTIDPADTEDVWDDTDFDVTVFEGDPLARLNMVFSGNNGGSLQVTNGGQVRGFKNRIFKNNHENFAAPGNIVATVPPGTGLMIMAADRVEVFDRSQDTAGQTIEDRSNCSGIVGEG